MNNLKTSLRGLLALGLILAITTAYAGLKGRLDPRNGAVPIILSVSPTSANPGQQVLVTVQFSEITVDWATLCITSEPGVWSSIPATVNVGPDQGYISFYATLSSSTEETSTTIWATMNYGTAWGSLTINQ